MEGICSAPVQAQTSTQGTHGSKDRPSQKRKRIDVRRVNFTSKYVTGGGSHRGNPAFEAELVLRTASQEAAFFLPFLRPGMRVLDLGCGPGSITLGLAEAVAPGEIVGVDVQPSQVAQAQALSASRGVMNVRFEVAESTACPSPMAPSMRSLHMRC
jgi:2-polyprenyl-3-methyl-5-hydroxy-6-metoxy-1,4-benzoquinol methylase